MPLPSFSSSGLYVIPSFAPGQAPSHFRLADLAAANCRGGGGSVVSRFQYSSGKVMYTGILRDLSVPPVGTSSLGRPVALQAECNPPLRRGREWVGPQPSGLLRASPPPSSIPRTTPPIAPHLKKGADRGRGECLPAAFLCHQRLEPPPTGPPPLDLIHSGSG